jgi:hypothetical protein
MTCPHVTDYYILDLLKVEAGELVCPKCARICYQCGRLCKLHNSKLCEGCRMKTKEAVRKYRDQNPKLKGVKS